MSSQSSATFGDAETKYFYSLTPDRILDAVETLGFRCTGRSMALNSMENRVYDVEIEVENEKLWRNSPERFRIVKFYRPGRWSEEQILAEHKFLLDLVEYDIPVVAPIVLESGETLQKIPDSNIWCAVFPKVGGRSPNELANDQLPLVGRLLARLHNVGAIKKAPSRVELNVDTYGIQPLEYLLDNEILPPHIEERYEDAVDEICDLTAPWLERAEVQRIHGDCHLGNLLWGDEGFFWVDFDDMLQGPCVQDLWLILPGRDEYALEQRRILLEAYEQMRPFDRSTIPLIESLRSLRLIHFDAWIARRWSDPAFPKTFVEFGSERYWSEQLQQLEEQLQLIRRDLGESPQSFF